MKTECVASILLLPLLSCLDLHRGPQPCYGLSLLRMSHRDHTGGLPGLMTSRSLTSQTNHPTHFWPISNTLSLVQGHHCHQWRCLVALMLQREFPKGRSVSTSSRFLCSAFTHVPQTGMVGSLCGCPFKIHLLQNSFYLFPKSQDTYPGSPPLHSGWR